MTMAAAPASVPARRAASERARATSSNTGLAAQAATIGVTVATVIGFARVFRGWDFIPALLGAAVVSHGLAIAVRRSGAGLVVATIASLVGLAEFTTLAFHRTTIRFWLPTYRSWTLIRSDISGAWKTFPTAIAPQPAIGGFLISAVLAVWIAAFLADAFAFRARATVETLLPSVLLFIFASAVGSSRGRVVDSIVWGGAALVHVVLHRAWRDEGGSGWLTSNRAGATSSAVTAAATVGGVALLAAALLGPALPGAGKQALVNTRNESDQGRQIISPLVDIKGRISNRSDVEVFTVKTDHPSYYRLTALETFTGSEWRSKRSFGNAKGRLKGGLPTSISTTVQQDITIAALDTELWLPAAYAPEQITGIKNGARYDDESSTLVVGKGDVNQGDTYTVVSGVPNLSADQIRATLKPGRPTIDSTYLQLPADFPSHLVDQARAIAAGSTSTLDQALALQNFFQTNFTYDLNVPKGQSTTAIDDFLARRTGYCEQFAGTFAAFARALGLPSRVAVGFTPGDLGDDGLYHVRGRHAHAWPEVYLSGIGWLPFEPTPTRGDGNTTAYTGVAAQQEGTAAVPVTTAAPISTQVPSAASIPSARPINPNETVPQFDGVPVPVSKGRSGLPGWLVRTLIALAAIVAVGGLWYWLVPFLTRTRWRRRRTRATTNQQRVLVTWNETIDTLDRAGHGPLPSETPREFASRTAGQPGIPAPLIESLAGTVTTAAYDPAEMDSAAVADCDDVAHQLTRAAVQSVSRSSRLAIRLDPRPLVHPLPGDERDDSLILR